MPPQRHHLTAILGIIISLSSYLLQTPDYRPKDESLRISGAVSLTVLCFLLVDYVLDFKYQYGMIKGRDSIFLFLLSGSIAASFLQIFQHEEICLNATFCLRLILLSMTNTFLMSVGCKDLGISESQSHILLDICTTYFVLASYQGAVRGDSARALFITRCFVLFLLYIYSIKIFWAHKSLYKIPLKTLWPHNPPWKMSLSSLTFEFNRVVVQISSFVASLLFLLIMEFNYGFGFLRPLDPSFYVAHNYFAVFITVIMVYLHIRETRREAASAKVKSCTLLFS